ncbi:MAG: magnesium-translocating P-type ATPase [Proteobacteria bacterium]|nr:magnesium-translocating P-type ATPase [Pseudomonadota bacterium]
MGHSPAERPFWTNSRDVLFATLGTGPKGLDSRTAAVRLQEAGRNSDAPPARAGAVKAVVRRLLEPLCLMLLLAGLVAVWTGDTTGGSIIVIILVLSIGLDTWQEGRATRAAELLRRSVAIKAEVLRDGRFLPLDVEEVVPGDVLRVRAGDVVPADGLLLEASALTVGEAALTGEPYPVEKRCGPVESEEAADATNAVFRGSVVQTGEGLVLAAATGRRSVFGRAAASLAEPQGQSPFQRELHAFGLLIARLTIALIVVVLVAHMAAGRPVLESLMFSAALAVGLTPELLPMITTVTLSRGALRMAARKVIVKRLASIHDLGAMTILCTDKTGTLTMAEIVLAESLDRCGVPSDLPAKLAGAAAALGGDRGSLDAALIAARPEAATGWRMLARRAFDYERRVGSVLVQGADGPLLIVKGAPEAVIALCALDAGQRETALALMRSLAERGLRSIAVASRPWTEPVRDIEPADETGLSFVGLCAFADPVKPTTGAAVHRLEAAGVRVKILSGDDPVIVRKVAAEVGIAGRVLLTGAEIRELNDEALMVRASEADLFARLAPDQKSRIVKALSAGNEVVGFLGDGINDAPGLKAADVGLSVEGATGVAQAAADMILLAPDLEVVADGVEEGRRTFANILKYVRMGASSNFGNMLSMAAASLFLPFLPMLPVQVLLNNLFYDVSEIGIPFDNVRPEATARPQVWNLGALMRFAAIMGPLSSAFDLLTFAGLMLVFHAAPDEFRTLWFLESMATQILVVFIIRTNGRPWHSAPHPVLAASSLAALVVALATPFLPVAAWLGFVTPSLAQCSAIGLVVAAYLVCAELLKAVAIGR